MTEPKAKKHRHKWTDMEVGEVSSQTGSVGVYIEFCEKCGVTDACASGDHDWRRGPACAACGAVNYHYLGYLSGVARRAKKAGRTPGEQTTWEYEQALLEDRDDEADILTALVYGDEL